MDALDRLDAQEQIGQLVARYAVAYDARDRDQLAALYAPEAAPAVPVQGRTFHLVAPPVISFESPDAATGVVLCRVEREAGDKWIVSGIRYDDRYVQLDGRWVFASRSWTALYSGDVLSRPS